MKKNLALSIVVVICVIIAAVVYLRYVSPAGMRAAVAPADDREFFPVAHSLLGSATKTIDVILYQSRFYFQYPASKSNALVADLIEASGRGVEVRVIMERADWNLGNTEDNRDVAQVLEGSGVKVYFDPPSTTSHTKLIIVDGKYVIVGSNNWNHYALDINNEANVVIDSRGAARAFTRYFEDIVEVSDFEYVSPIEPITAEGFGESSGRYVLLVDVGDSAYYDAASQTGYLHIDGLKVAVNERPLEEIRTIDPDFFTKVAGETVRVLARINLGGDADLEALDVEYTGTPSAIAAALERELDNLAETDFIEGSPEWIEDARVMLAVNRDYATEIKKLIDSAQSRIWIAMLDARYYDATPRTAANTKGPDEIPSLTNMVLGELAEAAIEGIDVRMVCDMGWSGSPPPDRVIFMEKLKAAGGRVYTDSPDLTTHAKLVIVDDDFVVVGSTNWSYHALEENNETSVIIQSEELNKHYAGYIEALIADGAPFEG